VRTKFPAYPLEVSWVVCAWPLICPPISELDQ